jgi:hypothetical protein
VKKIVPIIVGGSLLLGAGLFFLSGHPPAASGPKVLPEERKWEINEGELVFINIVIDGPDVYLGKDRIPKEEASVFIAKYAEINGIKKASVHATETARYGDIVRLIGSRDFKRFSWIIIGTRSLPVGTRLEPIEDLRSVIR